MLGKSMMDKKVKLLLGILSFQAIECLLYQTKAKRKEKIF
jgi:hypothetical protein